VVCLKPSKPITGSITVPQLQKLAGKTVADLAALTPTKVFSYIHSDGSFYLGTFGMTLSDGQTEVSHSTKCNKVDALPTNIRKIEMFFLKDEQQMHSMVFYGDSTLSVGQTPAVDQKATKDGNSGWTKGRQETFNVPAGERLIGCQIFHSADGYMRGISWITMK
jgi:hypothetical protein